MSELKIKGKLIKDFGIVEVSDKFRKREFVIETDGDYTQKVKFQLTQNKVYLLDNCKDGCDLTVHFNIRGNEWKENFYVNLDAWRLEKGNSGSTNSAPKTENEPKKEQPKENITEGEDDLPF